MQDAPTISTPEGSTPPLEPVVKQPEVSMTPPSDFPTSSKKKSSSLVLTLLLAILALGGIGFGVYAWFFRPAEKISSTCAEDKDCPKCEECKKCAENETGCPECLCFPPAIYVDNGDEGQDRRGYTISIEDENNIVIGEHTWCCALAPETYHIEEGAYGLVNVIRLMSRASESGSAEVEEVSNMFGILENLTDEQLSQVLEYITNIPNK